MRKSHPLDEAISQLKETQRRLREAIAALLPDDEVERVAKQIEKSARVIAAEINQLAETLGKVRFRPGVDRLSAANMLLRQLGEKALGLPKEGERGH